MKTINRLIFVLPFLAFGSLFVGCDSTSSSSKTANDSTSKSNAITEKTVPANAVEGVLPFNIEFEEQSYNGKKPFPHLQSYVSTVTKDGYILVIGGRRQGLHTFKGFPGNNFVADSSNNFIFLLDPKSGDSWSFDANKLDGSLSAPLQSTNQQFYHDRESGNLYVVGGYGWLADKSNMTTFNTIISFQVEAMVAALKSAPTPVKISSLIKMSQDDRLAVTGGELFKMNGKFFLVFGQKFTGQYRGFGGSDFTQKYTEEIRTFTLIPNTLKILAYGATTNTEKDKPFHRRDGNIIEDIDPSSGNPRIAALGGVFQPGIIGAYTYPVYIHSTKTPFVDRSGNQKFSQYECPVISVFDNNASNASVFHTFFGGIGHYYYTQTDSQKAIYDLATKQGRNDGFPFVEDVSTFQYSADGTYKEFINTKPIVNNRLLGSSIRFNVNPDLMAKGMVFSNGVIKLNAIPNGNRLLVGYIFGGIEAENPLPKVPNTGTFVSNSLFAVYLTHSPTAAIPAENGHESTKNDANIGRR